MQYAVRYNAFLYSQIESAAANLPRDAVCLDHGAGTGRFLSMAKAIFGKMYAVEIDANYMNELSVLGAVVTNNLSNIPDNSIDVAWSFNVLEHIEDDQQTLQQLVRVLKPGGRLVVFVPAFDCIFSKMDERVGHLRRYTLDDLFRKAMIAGAFVESARYVDSLGFLAAWLYRKTGGTGSLTASSIKLYDGMVFPLSQKLDLLTSCCFGKNVLLHATKHCHRTMQLKERGD